MKIVKNTYILALDMGGTKTNASVFELTPGLKIHPVFSHRFVNSEYKSPDQIIGTMLDKAPKPDIAVIAVAAPIKNNSASFTNIKWKIDGGAISRKFKIKKVCLINDLEATAYGLPLLKKKDMLVLQKGKPGSGNIAVIAPGTGLGEAILFKREGGYSVSSTEGGHTDFAPYDSITEKLRQHLVKKYGHASYERVVSGQGIENINYFLTSKKKPAAVIAAEAHRGKKTSKKTMEIFLASFGAEAGNLALKSLSTSGVYLAGGIPSKILPMLKDKRFLKAFCAKGVHAALMRRIPVSIVLNDSCALLGAVHFAVMETIGIKDKIITL